LGVTVEDITGRIEEDDASVPCQVVVTENCCVFVGMDVKIMLIAKRLDGRHCGGNRVMAKSCGFGEYENGKCLVLGLRLG
jgi:hypothetical protein